MPPPLTLRRLLAPLLLPLRNRIRTGPNQGRWWSLASGRYLKGTVEQVRMDLLERVIPEGSVVWDVGAHHGYVSLHASRCVGPSGVVYAFEPSPYNLEYLRRHLAWNATENVDLKALALAGEKGTATLGETGSSRTFRLGTKGVSVETACLPSLLSDEGLLSPDVLKLDVEGAEGEVLEAAVGHLKPSALILVAIHSMDNYRRVRRTLEGAAFTVVDSAGTRRLKKDEPGAWSDDPDLLAYGRAAVDPGDRVRALLERI